MGGSAYQNGDGMDAGKAALMSTQVWLPGDAIRTSSGNYEAGGWMEESEAQERDWVMNVELSLVTGSTHNMRPGRGCLRSQCKWRSADSAPGPGNIWR